MPLDDHISVAAPATVANLTVGFDCLGLALERPLERLELRRTTRPGVIIASIHGCDGLPMDPERNVSGRAAMSALEALGVDWGVELTIHKAVLPGSGIGSSAASAASAAFGVAALAGATLTSEQLLPLALDGEQVASGARHADNVAPALLGGLCLVTPEGQVDHLPAPDWHLTVVHPQTVIETARARSVLPTQVALGDALGQMARLGHFVHCCHTRDAQAAALALEDVLAEPHRIPLQPHFRGIRQAAMDAGATAGGISGSGPSSYWVSLSASTARAVGEAVSAAFTSHGMEHHVHVGRVAERGAHVLEN
ncbi:MAG: homoserine kinase [Planctomycetota bacterium]|nr:homoserine kinase [Planctomycetota bacterium]MDG1982988.1 homoserine kinase [Planctomycetota bacterium]